MKLLTNICFRPPTGVNHYEWKQGRLLNNDTNRGFRPPTGVNHYEYKTAEVRVYVSDCFRPPTGVNHYELSSANGKATQKSVSVPLQGLTIMNYYDYFRIIKHGCKGFPSPYRG